MIYLLKTEGDIQDVVKTRDSYKNKSSNRESVLLYGWGDGGGGPTEEHIVNKK